jgi:hypothetical protein
MDLRYLASVGQLLEVHHLQALQQDQDLGSSNQYPGEKLINIQLCPIDKAVPIL